MGKRRWGRDLKKRFCCCGCGREVPGNIKKFLLLKILINIFTIDKMLLKTIANRNIQRQKMNDLLTAKQVQEILNIDRTTVYRMLKDGRLNGVKIGQHWRFPKEQILSLIERKAFPGQPAKEGSPSSFPIHCIQGLQDVFAEISALGSIMVDRNGSEVTRLSNSCAFCRLIQSSSSGLRACRASWKAITTDNDKEEGFFRCHAGLFYTNAEIHTGKNFVSFLIAGQFFPTLQAKERAAVKINELAKKYHLDGAKLLAAFDSITVLSEKGRASLSDWMGRVAQTLVNLMSERSRLIEKLKKISVISSIE